MSLEVIDISRKEVERWLSAGTLNLHPDSVLHRDITDDYVLVSMFSCFSAHYDANWLPEVACTFDDSREMEVAARNIEHEELAELHGRYYCCSWEVWHLVDDWYNVDSYISSFPVHPFSPKNIFMVNCVSVSNSHSGLSVGDVAIVRRFEYFDPGNSDWVEIEYEVINASRNLSCVMRCIDRDLTDFHMYFDFDKMRWCLINDELWYVVGRHFYDNQHRVYYNDWEQPYSRYHIVLADPDDGICSLPYMYAKHDFLSKWKAHPEWEYDARCNETIYDFSLEYLKHWFRLPFGDSFTIDDMRAMYICLGLHGWVYYSEDEDNDLECYVDVYNRRYYAFADGDDYASPLNDLKRSIESLRFVANDYDRKHDYFDFTDISNDLEELRAAGDCDIQHDKPLKDSEKPKATHAVLSIYDDGLPF